MTGSNKEGMQMVNKIKVTDSFTVTDDDGQVHLIQEHTRYTVKKVAGVNREELGASYLKTEDDRGVIKNPDNTYSIPSLAIKAAR